MLNSYRVFWGVFVFLIICPLSLSAQNEDNPYGQGPIYPAGTVPGIPPNSFYEFPANMLILPQPVPSTNKSRTRPANPDPQSVDQPPVLEKETSPQDPNDSEDSEWIQPQPASKADKSPLDAQIIKILQSPAILSGQDRKKLSELIGKIKQSSLGEASLKKISDQLVVRVNSDIQSLRVILENVEALSEDRFGRTVAKIQEKEIKRLWNQLEKLSSQIEENRPRYGKSDNVSRNQYLDNITRQSSFCVENFSSVPALFEKVKQVVKPAYDQWNKKYASMGFDGQESDSDNINKPIPYEERKFAQAFARMQTFFRRLTEVNSQEF